MATVNDAITWIQARVRGIEGIRRAYNGPAAKSPESLEAIAYAPNGAIYVSTPAQGRTDYHDIIIQLHTPLKDLERDYATLTPYIEKMAAVICDDLTWGGNVESIAPIEGIMPYTLGPAVWGSIDILRLQFTVTIKIVQV